MFGSIKGYTYSNISKRLLKKEEYLSEVKEKDKDIEKEIQEIIQNKGFIRVLRKKKIIKAIYLFEKKDNNLIFKKSIITDEIDKEKQDSLEKIIVAELSEYVAVQDIKSVDFKDKVIEPKMSSFNIPMFSVWFSLGIVYGLLFDNLALGICFGLAVGLSMGTVIKNK